MLDAVVCLSLSVGFCLSLRVRCASHSRAGRQRFSVFLVLTEMRRVHCLIALRPAVVALLSLFSCDCFVFGFALPQTAAHLTHACVHPAAFTCSTSTCRSNRGKSHYALVQVMVEAVPSRFHPQLRVADEIKGGVFVSQVNTVVSLQ